MVLVGTQTCKTFLYQVRKTSFVSQTNMESPSVLWKAFSSFGAEARGAAGYGFWQTICSIWGGVSHVQRQLR